MSRRFGIRADHRARADCRRCRTGGDLGRSRSRSRPRPARRPFHAAPKDLGFADSKPITFFVIGDSGGIKDPNPQNAVSDAMQAHGRSTKPAFVYHVGDLVYFNGDESEYPVQLYEAYAHLNGPYRRRAREP